MFDYKKSVQATALLAKLEGGNINYMKAVKLIWLCDRYHLRNNGRTITGDIYFAMKDGPVASSSYDMLKLDEPSIGLSVEEIKYRNLYLSRSSNKYMFSLIAEPYTDLFSKRELDVINMIHDEYKGFNQFRLSEISHSFPEWIKYKESLESEKRVKIAMDLFFENCPGSKLFNDSEEDLQEMIEYSKVFFPQLP